MTGPRQPRAPSSPLHNLLDDFDPYTRASVPFIEVRKEKRVIPERSNLVDLVLEELLGKSIRDAFLHVNEELIEACCIHNSLHYALPEGAY